MLAILVKSGSPLFDAPTWVEGHVRKDGVVVKPHLSKRKHAAAQEPHQHSLFGDAPAAAAPEGKRTKLDAFISRHGGAERVRQSVQGMTGEQRAKIIEAMAGLADATSAEIIEKLGLHAADYTPAAKPEPEKPAAPDLQEAVKRALFVLEGIKIPERMAAGGLMAALRTAGDKPEALQRRILERALYAMELPSSPSYVNAAGTVDYVRDALNAGKDKLDGSFNMMGIRKLTGAADDALTGAADRAITGFIGVPPGTVDDPDGADHGLMNARPLEAAYASDGDGGETRQQIEEAFAPVREAIRAKVGDTVTCYRYQAKVSTSANTINMSAGEGGARSVLSWTTDRQFAEHLAGVGKKRRIFTEEEIVAAERQYEETGVTQMPGMKRRQLHRTTSDVGGKEITYPMIIEDDQEITDADSVRAWLGSENEERAAENAKRDTSMQQIITADIPLNEVVWASDRAGQSEFIVRNRPEAVFVAADGTLTVAEPKEPEAAVADDGPKEGDGADYLSMALKQIGEEVARGKGRGATDKMFGAALARIASAALERFSEAAPADLVARLQEVVDTGGKSAMKPVGPKEGDTKTENGVEYVLRDGRWWRATPDDDVEAAEDRADLAEAMAKDPHGDEAKGLISKLGRKKEASHPPPPVDDLDPSSPNYRFRDTGYIAGSRKEMAAEAIRSIAKRGGRVRLTDVDWDALEENPREAKDLIIKANLFGGVDWQGLRDEGFEPGAAFLISKVYAAVASAPAEDTAEGRHDYAEAINTLRDRMERAKTVGDVIDLIAEIGEERDGVLLNDEERVIYTTAMEEYKAASAIRRGIEAQHEALYKRESQLASSSYADERTVRQRKDRGWKVDPALEAKVAGTREEIEKLRAERDAFRKENGMNPTSDTQIMPDGLSRTTRLTYPIRADEDRAYAKVKAIRAMATIRNMRDNVMTRAWKSLGKGFQAVVDYRSHKGSDAFGKHVATVKAGRVENWDWAEKDTAPRGATGRSKTFELQVASDIVRKGGRPVGVDSTASLKQAFNLREVQSGNWVLDDPNSAKFHVERCAEGFADLADLLGISDDRISFNGRLAMAFGARGKGRAKAHYEPIERVINMTKMSGAGSLAHEWFHCVDNLVKEAVTGLPSGAEDFATLSPASVNHPALQEAFGGLMRAITTGPHRQMGETVYTEAEERFAAYNMDSYRGGRMQQMIKAAESVQAAVDAVDAMFTSGHFGPVAKKRAQKTRDDWKRIAIITKGGNAERRVVYEKGPAMSMYMIDAMQIDKGESGKYWSAPHEMAARAFSSFIEDKMHADGRENTYLSANSNNAHYDEARPFPEGAEREAINAAFDKLFDVIRAGDVLAKAAAIL